MSKAYRAYIRASAAVLFGIGGITCASAAYACDDPLARNAAMLQGNGVGLIHEADMNDQGGHSIVGLWSFRMTAGGQTADFGYQQWHSDGTELMNSGGRAPASENFCMGVWRQVAPSKYHLNHFALSYDPSSGALNARVNIKEDVMLDPTGRNYAGTFTIDVYDPSGTTAVAHQSGQVTAQRVLAN